MPRQTVLLAGATCMLGARIAEHLLDSDDVSLKLLVRQGALEDPAKRPALDSLAKQGAELVIGDVSDPASLEAATRGVDVVVSALQGGRDVIVDGQVALARAAAANGVRRMLPSDFALDHFKATPGEHATFDWRCEADEQIAALDIEQINVLNGAFLDGVATPGAAVIFDDEAGTATFWGSGDEHFEATTVDDTARYTARVALDPGVSPGKFAIAADNISFNQIVTAHERATGRRYEPRSRGDLDDLDDLRTWIDARVQEGDHDSALMGRYVQYMLSGQTQLDDLQNDRYPDIEPDTLDDLRPIAQG
jgi:uncharacterized protein YbjT (DUF2867 family)